LFVHAFAVDGKRAGAAEKKGLQLVVHEEVGAGEDEEGLAELFGEGAEDEGVFIAAVVGGDEDAVTGGDGGAEFFRAGDFDVGYAIAAAEVAREIEVEHSRPKGAVIGEDWDVGFI
jgi:hypothetical protein